MTPQKEPAMTHAEIYNPMILCRRKSLLSGSGEEWENVEDMLADECCPPVLREWIEDVDLQEITVVSTNIGFTRTYTRFYNQLTREQQT